MSWHEHIDAGADAALADLTQFCRIPSISTDPQRAADCRRAADWVAARLRRAGVTTVELLETAGHPVVVGDWLGVPGAPTILVYGHYDVQPPDPVEAWTTPPFEPAVRDGRLYARGASDDKGNMLAPILAAEAHLRDGDLPVNLRFFFEGEEEIGSPSLPPVFADHADRLRPDVAFSADGGQWSEDRPSLTMSLRGICALQVDVSGPDHDLHSGMYGGAVRNPASALAALLASLHDADGRVTVDGFYDDVLDLSDDERRRLAEVPFDAAAFLRDTGAPALHGEAGYSTRERTWVRPTLEINGMWSGAIGAAMRSIVPATAHARISCRLVADQDPARIVAAVQRHLTDRAAEGVTVAFTDVDVCSAAYRIAADHPAQGAAARVLEEIVGQPPLHVGVGGSIPVLNLFRRYLGVDTVGFAFALTDENAHGPDEFFRLSSFQRAQHAWARLFEVLAEST